MEYGGIFCIAVVIMFTIPIVIYFISQFFPSASAGSRKTHSADHPGITKGNKDIICPKCKSPYCQYYFEDRLLTAGQVRTKTKVHPLNPFKPFVEEKHRVIPGQTVKVTRYRCNNCGWIFD